VSVLTDVGGIFLRSIVVILLNLNGALSASSC